MAWLANFLFAVTLFSNQRVVYFSLQPDEPMYAATTRVEMNCEIYHSLDDLPDSIVELCSYPRCENFFWSLDWFRNLRMNALGPDFEPLIFAFSRTGGAPEFVFFCGTDDGGRTVRSMTNFYTISYQPVIHDECITVERAISTLLGGIRKILPGVRKVQLQGLMSDSIGPLARAGKVPGSGCYAHAYHQHKNWYQTVSKTNFENYYAQRSSRLRNTIKRKEKKLAKTDAYKIQVVDSPGPELDTAIASYVHIYNNSWKTPEPFPDFTPGLIVTAATLGILRLGILTVADSPAAAQLWINTPSKAMIYKLAYTDEYSKHSPGSILSREMFRIAIDDDKVAEIDYGVGDDNYKKDWMETVRGIVGIEAYNLSSVGGLTLSALHVAMIPIRQLKITLSQRSDGGSV